MNFTSGTRGRLCACVGTVAVAALATAACSGTPSMSLTNHLSPSTVATMVHQSFQNSNVTFTVQASATMGGSGWKYRSVGFLNFARGTGRQSQVDATGRRYQASDTPGTDLVPTLATDYTRSTIYVEAWGSIRALLAKAGKSWMSVTLTDTTQGPLRIIQAIAATSPFIFLDALEGAHLSAKVEPRSAASSSKIYDVSLDVNAAGSAVPGIDAGLLSAFSQFSNTSVIPMTVTVGSGGRIQAIAIRITAPAQVTVTFSFTGSKVPATSASVGDATPPPADQVISITTAARQSAGQKPPTSAPPAAGSTGTTEAGGAPGPETCAEDKADGGTDAKTCASTTTTAPSG